MDSLRRRSTGGLPGFSGVLLKKLPGFCLGDYTK